MNLYEALHARRTIHDYLDTPVSDEVIQRIISAAHMAPNHKMTWPWRFTVVGPKTRLGLLPIAFALKNATSEKMQARIRAKLLNAGALVVVTQVLDGDPFRDKEDYAATCCAIQNMQLAAYGEGLGAKWSTGGLTKHPDVLNHLGIDGATEDVVGFIWIGTPAKVPSPIERPDIESMYRSLD